VANAKWNGKVIAESDQVEIVEGNVYFPAKALNTMYFKPSSYTSVCSWKGVASYYDVVVDGKINNNAAWYYADPKAEAKNISGFIAFWKGVEVSR
jgi:uncharacterized protein (DUF427 family)